MSYHPRLPKRNVLTDNNVADSPVTGSSVSCYISSIRISNTTGSAITFDLADAASTPNQWYEAVSVGANGAINEQFPEGQELYCAGGFNYNASAATGLDLQIVYWTKP